VLCSKTAIAACQAIITEGEGASVENPNSHFCRFRAIRDEYQALKAKNPNFVPAHPAAVNPVLRRPMAEERVWLEDEPAAAGVDIANVSYQTMLRLIAYSYAVPGPDPEKSLAVDLGIDLMKVMTLLGESAARRPAGPSNPGCNAGVSFTALRDTAPLPRVASTRRYFVERMAELAKGAGKLDQSDMRVARATGLLKALAVRARNFEAMASAPTAAPAAAPTASAASPAQTQVVDGVEYVEGEKLQIIYKGKLCIHSRFCVTGAPKVFLANVQGPWIHPDDMDAEELMAVARECPSRAIQYKRHDGGPEEHAPPVNLISVREAGPYAFRGDLRIDGASFGYRATLCRCGASKNKPFCDGSHHDVNFNASGEPPTGDKTEMLAIRDGVIDIAPQLDGPLMVRGNMEFISGTGRVIARQQTARLCRCGHSNTKPFCDGTHAKVGFRSTWSSAEVSLEGAEARAQQVAADAGAVKFRHARGFRWDRRDHGRTIDRRRLSEIGAGRERQHHESQRHQHGEAGELLLSHRKSRPEILFRAAHCKRRAVNSVGGQTQQFRRRAVTRRPIAVGDIGWPDDEVEHAPLAVLALQQRVGPAAAVEHAFGGLHGVLGRRPIDRAARFRLRLYDEPSPVIIDPHRVDGKRHRLAEILRHHRRQSREQFLARHFRRRRGWRRGRRGIARRRRAGGERQGGRHHFQLHFPPPSASALAFRFFSSQ